MLAKVACASEIQAPADNVCCQPTRDSAFPNASSWAAPAVRRHQVPTVFVVGYPSDLGGADTECWHTARLWRQAGWEVNFLPAWRPRARWHARLSGIGCQTLRCDTENLESISGLRDGIVVSFCNSHFLQIAGRLRQLGCRLVWVNCMTRLFPRETELYAQHGPFDSYVFQSRYQQSELEPQLARFGVQPEQCHCIRGAFCCDEFPFRPLAHASDQPFVIGRLSRPAPDKFASTTWGIYARVCGPRRARIMGWGSEVQAKLGPPPKWGECLPAAAESAQQFLASLHCLMPINGGARENWPRAGLEAMSAGVPLVVENRWGWPEMVRDGETGYLCDTTDDFVENASRLARDEVLRLRIARQARYAVEVESAAVRPFIDRWHNVLTQAFAGRRHSAAVLPAGVGEYPTSCLTNGGMSPSVTVMQGDFVHES